MDPHGILPEPDRHNDGGDKSVIRSISVRDLSVRFSRLKERGSEVFAKVVS
jgi:hypothetical protein